MNERTCKGTNYWFWDGREQNSFAIHRNSVNVFRDDWFECFWRRLVWTTVRPFVHFPRCSLSDQDVTSLLEVSPKQNSGLEANSSFLDFCWRPREVWILQTSYSQNEMCFAQLTTRLERTVSWSISFTLRTFQLSVSTSKLKMINEFDRSSKSSLFSALRSLKDTFCRWRYCFCWCNNRFHSLRK